MQPKIVYNIDYYEDDEPIDSTQIDELNEELIWDLFEEYGHTKTNKSRFEVEECLDED